MMSIMEATYMVGSVPVIPRIQVTTVRKVDRKPTFRDEDKHKNEKRQLKLAKNQLSQKTPSDKKGTYCDILL